MNSFFRDYGMGILSILIPVLMTIYIFFRQRKFKKLEYEVLLNYNLFDIRADLKEKISIVYNGNQTENLRLVIVKMLNQGNLPILKSDFESNIEICFNNQINIIDAEVYEKLPLNIDLNIEFDKSKVSLKPCLLNPYDYFIIRIFLDGKESELQVTSRIAGVNKINKISSIEETPVIGAAHYIFLCISLIYVIYAVFSLNKAIILRDENNFKGVFLSVTLTICMMSSFIIFFIKKPSKKR